LKRTACSPDREMLRQRRPETERQKSPAMCKLIRFAANGRNRRALLSLVGQIKLSDSAFTIYPPQLDDNIDRLLNVLPYLSEGQWRTCLQNHYG
jgi:hypothetical protein